MPTITKIQDVVTCANPGGPDLEEEEEGMGGIKKRVVVITGPKFRITETRYDHLMIHFLSSSDPEN